jgi:hypothetical protein
MAIPKYATIFLLQYIDELVYKFIEVLWQYQNMQQFFCLDTLMSLFTSLCIV